MPEATTTITVADTKTGIIVARFSSSSMRGGGTDGNNCQIAIYLDGTYIGGADFDADETGAGDYYESHIAEASKAGVGRGTHTIAIRARVVGWPPASTFLVDRLARHRRVLTPDLTAFPRSVQRAGSENGPERKEIV